MSNLFNKSVEGCAFHYNDKGTMKLLNFMNTLMNYKLLNKIMDCGVH